MVEVLTAATGVVWIVVYVECIRLGFAHKTFAVPTLVLGLNVGWELVFSWIPLFVTVDPATRSEYIQAIINTVWAVLDLLICVTYWLYAPRYWPRWPRWLPRVWLLALIALSAVFQAMLWHGLGTRAVTVGVFMLSVVSSGMWLGMLAVREGTEGQSWVIAVGKFLGTALATVAYGILPGDLLVIVVGGTCAVLDLGYIALYATDPRRRRSASWRDEVVTSSAMT